MSYGGNGDDESTLKLRVVYEASQVVKDAIADIRKLKEETGSLNKEQEDTLKQLEYQKTLLDGAGSGLDHYTDLVHEETTAQKLMRQALEETTVAVDAQATIITTTAAPAAREAAAGFDVLAKQAFQAERVFTMMSGGAGLARAGPMLEKLLTTLGGPAGLGFALVGIEFAVEKLLPTIEKLFGMSNTAAMKEAAEYWERIAKAANSLAESKTKAEKKTAGEISEFITESNAQVVLDAITHAITKKAEKTATPEEQALMDKAAELPSGGMTAAIALHPMMAYRAVQSRVNIRETIAKQSQELLTQMATDPSARGRVMQMAIETPGAFPPGFGEGLRGFTPEAEAAGEKDVEEAIAFGERAHKAGAARREHAKQENQATRERAKGAAERYAEEQRKEREAKALTAHEGAQRYALEQKKEHDDKSAQDKADREHAKAVREHDRQQRKYEHEHTPEALRHRAAQAEREQVAGYVGMANQQYGFARTQGGLDEITHAATRNVNTGMDIATAVQRAVAETQEKIQRDFLRGMRRQGSVGEMRGQ